MHNSDNKVVLNRRVFLILQLLIGLNYPKSCSDEMSVYRVVVPPTPFCSRILQLLMTPSLIGAP